MGAIRKQPVSDGYFGLPEESKRPLKLLIEGNSGNGKTFTALELAWRFGKPWAILATAEDADRIDDYRRCNPSMLGGGWERWAKVRKVKGGYPTSVFTEAIDKAVAMGFVGVIIDQLGCNWQGPGGILETVEIVNSRDRKAMSGWSDPEEGGNRLFNDLSMAIACCPIHLIVALRASTKFRPVAGEKNGRQVVDHIEKIENKIAHRDSGESITFAFDQILLLNDSHTGIFLKPEGKFRPQFNGAFAEPGEDVYQLLKGIVRA